MRLRAISIGSAVPREFLRGRVHSVFDRACNLRLLDGSLVTLVVSALGNVPQGIRLGTPASFDFPSSHLRPGQAVITRGDLLAVAGTSLFIDLRSARPWDPDLSRLRADFSRPDVRVAWSLSRLELDGHPLRDEKRSLGAILLPSAASVPNPSFDSTLAWGVLSSTLDLARAVKRLDLMAVIGLAEALIGLGPGLTPSGDDLLVGYLGGLWAAAGDVRERLEFLSGLARSVLSLAHRTNEISRVYLQHAAAGRLSEPLVELARAIAQGKADVRQATRNALRVGQSSGAYGVLGLLLGMRAW